MDTFIAAIFDTEEAALGGVDRIRELHNLADIHVFSGAVISKDAQGEVTLHSTVNEGPVGTATGYWIGALIGVLAGPIAVASGAVAAAVGTAAVAGAAAGGLTGSFLGMARDLMDSGLSEDVLSTVSTELKPGHVAVVALIDELATLPLDEAVEAEGGRLFRQPRNDVTDDRIAGDLEAATGTLADLRVEFINAREAERDLIKVKAVRARAGLSEQVTAAKERATALNSELTYRKAAIDEQASNASDERLQKLVSRRVDLSADFEAKLTKVNAAIEAAEATLEEDDWL